MLSLRVSSKPTWGKASCNFALASMTCANSMRNHPSGLYASRKISRTQLHSWCPTMGATSPTNGSRLTAAAFDNLDLMTTTRVHRHINAPRETVYRALLDADAVAK